MRNDFSKMITTITIGNVNCLTKIVKVDDNDYADDEEKIILIDIH